ncbi:MAG TPA: DISARM system helicase DrmA [Rhizomicrobium sp.]|nr:DISARM system helicase DrmA [Rhizomicrobium sp.]
MTTSLQVRSGLVDLLRRDLFGPHPEADADLAREVLSEKPSRWYVGGFIVPAFDGVGAAAPDEEEIAERAQDDLLASETLESPVDSDADEQEMPDQPPKDRYLPSSLGLTVMLPEEVRTVDLRVTWGDYKTEPPLPDVLLLPEAETGSEKKPERPTGLHWVRIPGEARLSLDVTKNIPGKALPGSAAPQRPGGGLEVALHQRVLEQTTPEGIVEKLRVVTVFLVNRRKRARAPYTDVAYAFQARIELACKPGFHARQDHSTYRSDDSDLRLADLHYRDVCEYAVGRNTSGGWDERVAEEAERLPVTKVWTEPMPTQEVEKVSPCPIPDVEFGMEALSELAQKGADDLASALAGLPAQYAAWRKSQESFLNGLAPRRRETALNLLSNVDKAHDRIQRGINLLKTDSMAREAFAIMNEAMAMAARRRLASIERKKLDEVKVYPWRPFQLAFILLNLVGLTDKLSPEREIVDLLFFPTGGGKTEAYLGLAAYTISMRRLGAAGVLGAGVSVIMRYTLRLLTLDQLSRAAGLICALEMIRTRDAGGIKALGTWPIEIGLWVGSGASPNRMKPRTGKTDPEAATTWLNRYKRDPKRNKSPVPLKACPWCGTPFTPDSFRIEPNRTAAHNLAIKCENAECDFTRDRSLPILVVDEPVYRRLPAFLIATVDKFAALPWVGQSGAFFGHVNRFDPVTGFYGAAEPGQGQPLDNGHELDPPDLIIQDELHLISGPLGTVAGLYEIAIDLLGSRQRSGQRIRAKIIASTATVRRAEGQIQRLFDRSATAIFPPPGVDRRNSFFARTVSASDEAARLYIGIASQGRGPKLLFLRTLQTVLAGAEALSELPAGNHHDPADPYLTVLAYFNALRELGGARRIVEGEVHEHVAKYGTERRRISPSDTPFANRSLRLPLELTSRVSTDDVAQAKENLGMPFKGVGGEAIEQSVDVALATNMISVGLDITRLGLMMVQGQPKTTAEYIQATSRVGRDSDRPGLVITLLNMHKPRDRTHYEHFRAYHSSFYRAVEASSITPFASRALDRALAGLLVASARHIESEMTPSGSVGELGGSVSVKTRVIEALRSRAIGMGVNARSTTRAVERAEELFTAWEDVVAQQSSGGSPFSYDEGSAQRRLLQIPLDPSTDNLSVEHKEFVAARSMRDVEYGSFLKVRDPFGNIIRGATDVE